VTGRLPPRSTLGRAVLVALLLFAASEIALRLLTDVDSRWYIRMGANKQWDPVCQFRNKPHYPLASGRLTNELGYDAPENLRPEAPADRLRIVYLGDSCTVMPSDHPYPRQAEALLEREKHRPIETVNAAVPGFDSENARLLFGHELSRFEAPYLFVYLGWNDLGHYGPEGLAYKRMEAGYELSPLQRALTHLYSLRFLYALQQVLRQREPTVDVPLSAADRALYDAYRPDHFYANLREILGLAKTRYPHVIIMTLATLTSPDPLPDEMRRMHFPTGMDRNVRKLDLLVAKYNQAVRTVAEEEGVPLLDLHALFDSHEARRGFTDSCHMTAEGAARIARAVADSVERDEAGPAGTR
jgi:lysophospholipase L1-like esterase